MSTTFSEWVDLVEHGSGVDWLVLDKFYAMSINGTGPDYPQRLEWAQRLARTGKVYRDLPVWLCARETHDAQKCRAFGVSLDGYALLFEPDEITIDMIRNRDPQCLQGYTPILARFAAQQSLRVV